MQSVRKTMVTSATLLLLAACADEKAASKPQGVTAPPVRASVAGTTSGGGEFGSSTVCVAYTKERDGYKKQLAGAPGDTRLQDQVRALDALITDACN